MNTSVKQVRHISATELIEGAGVTVHRTIGTPAMRNFDPFLLLDQISSDDPNEYIAGFPSHPHRGFNTFTYMIDGDMEHKDSLGNTGSAGSGGAQWMKAAGGVIHSEMPKQESGRMRGFQLWINLPAENKMDVPEYQEYNSDAFPVVDIVGASVKVIAGHYGEIHSPIRDEITGVRVLDVTVPAAQSFACGLMTEHNSFVYVFEGAGKIHSCKVNNQTLVTLYGDGFHFVAGREGARFLLISGRPIGESVVQCGPFVMNTREEINQAMRDYQSNNFVRDRARGLRRLLKTVSVNSKQEGA